MNDDKKTRHGPPHSASGTRPDDDDLSHKLRLGDPADDAPEIDPVELAQIRRTIVTAAYDAQDTRAGAWTWINVSRPLTVAFATIVIALFAVWLFTPTPGTIPGATNDQQQGAVADASPPTAPPGETQTESTSPEETPTLPDIPIEDTVPAEQISPSEQVTPPQTLEPESIAQPETTAATTVADASPPERQARTVQFTAPRGTRIIWTLDPSFESPLTEQTARQEQ